MPRGWGKGRVRYWRGGWIGTWPGKGPFSYLPPWQRPGWRYWRTYPRFGSYAYFYYPC